MARFSLAILLGLTTTCLQAQWIHQPTLGIPRTADGKLDLTAPAPKTANGNPDLSGLWLLTPAGGGIGQLKSSCAGWDGIAEPAGDQRRQGNSALRSASQCSQRLYPSRR